MRLLGIIVLVCVFCSINAAISFALQAINPDYPGKCWESHTKTAYDVGDHQLKGHCAELSCGPKFTMQIRTCGSVRPPPGYRNKVDLTKPYPDCCINLVQEEENGEAEQQPL